MSQSNIQVVLRFRPLLPFEEEQCWLADTTLGTISSMVSERLASKIQETLHKRVHQENLHALSYHYDSILTPPSTSQQIYNKYCHPIVTASLRGINGTICAYGQTCSGKTFSINGTDHTPGILPCVLKHIFGQVQNRESNEKTELVYKIFISYIQIYNEAIVDLLREKGESLKIVEDSKWGVQVRATRTLVSSFAEAVDVLQKGESQRTYRKKLNHDHSSRSHTIFRVYIETSNDTLVKSKAVHRYSVLNIVDLAGSERLTKHEEMPSQETGSINKSLFMLSNVITKLVDGQPHIPYRDSKLTRLLENSLGGNSSTLILCCLSPSMSSFQETLSTLRFANLVKKVKNTLVENKQEGEIHHLQSVIRDLQESNKRLEGRNKDLQRKCQALEVEYQLLKRDKSKERRVVKQKKENERDVLLLIDDSDLGVVWLNESPNPDTASIDKIVTKYKEKKLLVYKELLEQLAVASPFHIRECPVGSSQIKGRRELMAMLTTDKIQTIISLQCLSQQQKENIQTHYNSLVTATSTSLEAEKQRGVCLWGSNKQSRLGHDNHTENIPHQLDLVGTQLALGAHHSLLVSKGKVYGWGKNKHKQAGSSSLQKDQLLQIVSIPHRINFKTKICAVAAGWGHSLALDVEGGVFSWGFGEDGQLGHGNLESLDHPTLIEGTNNIQQVFAGHSHSAFIDGNKCMLTFGCNVDLRLMREGTSNTPLECFREVSTASLGVTHTCIVTDEGQLFGGGDGSYGQLGPLDQNSTFVSLAKTKAFDGEKSSKCLAVNHVEYFDKGRRVKAVSCGESFTLVLLNDGTMYAFGRGSFHRLGTGQIDNLFEPMQLKCPSKVSKIAAGSRHSLALTEEGNIYSWGFNLYHQLGIAKEEDVRTPSLVSSLRGLEITDICCGFFHSGLLFNKQ